jgi:hypothetical protein
MLAAFLVPFIMLQSAVATVSEEALRVPGIERLTYGFYQRLSRSGPDLLQRTLDLRKCSSIGLRSGEEGGR